MAKNLTAAELDAAIAAEDQAVRAAEAEAAALKAKIDDLNVWSKKR